MSNQEPLSRMQPGFEPGFEPGFDPGFDMAQAVTEADRCLLCHDAPCSRGCPANTRPDEFIRKLRFRNITGAIRTIKSNNILGGACAVLCPAHRLCEAKCAARLASQDRPAGGEPPIRIGRIQRFLVEHGWRIGFRVFEKPAPRREKVAVVGAGPGGLSCGAELAKEGYRVVIFESRPEPGGVLRYGVAAHRFDTRFLSREIQDIRDLGVTFRCNHPIRGRKGAENLLEEGFEAVFLAPGLWAAATLRAGGKPIDGVYSSVDYLAAFRDGRLAEMKRRLRGKTIAVIGGGSVAMDCIGVTAPEHPENLYLIYRRSFLQMPAEPDERIEAQAAGAHFLLLNQPVDYLTDDAGRLAGIKLIRTQLGRADASGRRRPEAVEGSQWTLPVDLVVEAIGNQAPEASVEWYPNVRVDDQRLIRADAETGKTSVDGIFAGGDIVRGPSLVVNAVQDGKKAARAISAYLNKNR